MRRQQPMSSSLTKAVRLLQQPLHAMWNEWNQPLVRGLYHYTNISNLKKILLSRCIWSMDLLTTNDTTEVRCAMWIVDFALKCRWGELPVHVSPYFNPKRLLDLGSTWFAFGASFSERSDSLSQWWRYGEKGTGVALELSGDFIGDDHQLSGEYALVRLRYSAVELMDAANFTCDLALELDRDQALTYCDHEALWSEVALIILSTLLHYKHPSFADEKEWRALTLEPIDSKRQIMTRMVDGRRYIELPLTESSVSRVITGPLVEDACRSRLSDWLTENGFDKVQIKPSRVPLGRPQ